MIFINGKELRWGSKIGRLLEEWKPQKDIKDDCLTLIWGDIKFFKSVLEASSVFYPEETLDANITGLRRMLDYYKSKELDGFLFFSSSEIYGDPFPEFIPK